MQGVGYLGVSHNLLTLPRLEIAKRLFQANATTSSDNVPLRQVDKVIYEYSRLSPWNGSDIRKACRHGRETDSESLSKIGKTRSRLPDNLTEPSKILTSYFPNLDLLLSNCRCLGTSAVLYTFVSRVELGDLRADKLTIDDSQQEPQELWNRPGIFYHCLHAGVLTLVNRDFGIMHGQAC